MPDYKIISGDSHIVEPPNLYIDRVPAKLRDRAPRMERRQTASGRDYDAWFYRRYAGEHPWRGDPSRTAF